MNNKVRIGIGMLGAGWMGKTHINAYKTAEYMFWEGKKWNVDLVCIGSSNEKKGKEAALRYGYKFGVAGYNDIISNDDVTVFDNVTPDQFHVEPTIDAALAGKHVICEKPLADNVADAKRMLDTVNEAGVKNMICFSYRFMPAIRLAKELIDEGKLGKIYHFTGRYYQDQGSGEKTPVEEVWYIMGTGVAQGIGSHMLDMIHFLVDDVKTVRALNKTYNTERPSTNGIVRVDSTEGAFAIMELKNGATATMENLGVANGKQSEFSFEIFGSKGSMKWNMEDPNLLYYYDSDPKDKRIIGYTKINVTEAVHPFMDVWWPKGHVLGWEHGHINMIVHFLNCVANNEDVAPLGGTFEDGYRVAKIIDAMNRSSNENKTISV